MKNDIKLGLYLMTSKGAAALRALATSDHRSTISYIVIGRDNNVANDYSDEIATIARSLDIPILERRDSTPFASYLLAVSWRWLIETASDQKLIVFHDSILPRYRGFAPLVSALINGDKNLGVTALIASTEYDRGPIIDQEIIQIEYPIKIANAIDALLPCYSNLAKKVLNKIVKRNIAGTLQDESQTTYSLWRDEQDYYINWEWDSQYIKRFVDALGFPYKGAATTIEGKTFRIKECAPLPDVKIEHRVAGKIIFIEGVEPVVVCGTGLLRISNITTDESNTNILPLQKFRTRFM